MFQKIWDAHVVHQQGDDPPLLYVDLHLVHEVTSAQAFEGLRMSGHKVRRPDLSIATADHNVPTANRLVIEDETSRKQVEALKNNCEEFGINYYGIDSDHQGIVHVIGPELGLTKPGMVIVCGDSHTATHGAFGALAMPIGTSQVEHVLATQTLVQSQPKSMEIRVDGRLPAGVTAKDVILGVIGKIGVGGAVGYVVEYTGETIEALSMEGRMTICNMTIEAGARVGMVAPDEKTFAYVKGREFAPKGEDWDAAVEAWSELSTDEGAEYDKTVLIDAAELEPYVTWGTNPEMVAPVTATVPDPSSFSTHADQAAAERALEYMALEPGIPIQEIKLDRVFIGSCTNARMEDLRAAAAVAKGRKVHADVYAMIVPGSMKVKAQAEEEGLDVVFREAGFDWREAGCSMCLGMNPDILQPGERCASTSNRNFEGRQGKGGRTHLVSPQMAAAAAIEGHFVDIREWEME